VKNRSAGQWTGAAIAVEPNAPAAQAPTADRGGGLEPVETHDDASVAGRAPLLVNYLLCALAGTTWYFQFFFYTMGESQMGRFGFSSWTLHMASIIIFGTIWGFAFREWKDATRGTKTLVWAGVGLLVLATAVIGYGNMLAA
jgi:L-rhamnose-H+ transport protein